MLFKNEKVGIFTGTTIGAITGPITVQYLMSEPSGLWYGVSVLLAAVVGAVTGWISYDPFKFLITVKYSFAKVYNSSGEVFRLWAVGFSTVLSLIFVLITFIVLFDNSFFSADIHFLGLLSIFIFSSFLGIIIGSTIKCACLETSPFEPNEPMFPVLKKWWEDTRTIQKVGLYLNPVAMLIWAGVFLFKKIPTFVSFVIRDVPKFLAWLVGLVVQAAISIMDFVLMVIKYFHTSESQITLVYGGVFAGVAALLHLSPILVVMNAVIGGVLGVTFGLNFVAKSWLKTIPATVPVKK